VEEWGQVGNPKFESVWYPHWRGANVLTLKQQRSVWEGDQKVMKRSGRHKSIQFVIRFAWKQY
jgi:hypothetical protein